MKARVNAGRGLDVGKRWEALTREAGEVHKRGV